MRGAEEIPLEALNVSIEGIYRAEQINMRREKSRVMGNSGGKTGREDGSM